ncbi:stage II sporulation protein AA (anti-sigma F factor antagonist) [Actinomadura pelletieri DSM 43383]|uniref:Anti-sigma factor antagonist n=1 Tax=Actinomadura pelletieri DSM 43383 TaxID=1120940 RepID=A0A495QY63_9ACTN|nr:STAS domain-containing protein [Actinomadura pelletieri]RKS78866.1 stage II sporulation protein AA (anti-sigma F factor antagonist) [Actinomadura pelletieri DSM 43383]
MPLTITHRRHRDLAVAVLTGEIDVATSAHLREDLTGLVASGARHLILDLHAVPLIDSGGLGVLVAIHDHLQAQHGSISLSSVSHRVRNVLRSTQLTRVFPIYATADVAVHAHQVTRAEEPDTGQGKSPPPTQENL